MTLPHHPKILFQKTILGDQKAAQNFAVYSITIAWLGFVLDFVSNVENTKNNLEEAFFALNHSKELASKGEQETSRQVHAINNRKRKRKKNSSKSVGLQMQRIYNKYVPE